MSSVKDSIDIQDLLTPWVLRAALRKVADWYRHEECYDPAEWLAWKAQPWEHLSQLAAELSSGSYRPYPFPLIPYPKKGDRTRHYVAPSVRDQVAFMAFIVLLGPFIEARMPNVSFGNRLFRPRVLSDAMVTANEGAPNPPPRRRWLRAPFSLGEPRLYDRFEAGYGLFRRLLQWIVRRIVLGREVAEAVVDEMDLEDPHLLPYSDVLRNGLGESSADLFYARIDLSLAYPSVDRQKLRSQLIDMLKIRREACDRWGRPSFPCLRVPGKSIFSSWIEPERQFTGRHPWHILASDQKLLLSVAEQLCDMLDQVVYCPWNEPESQVVDGVIDNDLVNPRAAFPDDLLAHYQDDKDRLRRELERYDTHGIWPADCHLPNEWLRTHRFGLPTGLAVSGVLLNVALTPVDEHMCSLYEQALRGQKPPVFYLRFVDDIVLLSPDIEAMERAIQDLKVKLEEAGKFRISTDKAKPESLREYLESLYRDANSTHGNGQRLRLKPTECITRGNVEMFTTAVVREISEIADEGLDEAFGTPGLARLEDLLDLASREDDDWEVAKDARLTFAVNQLARATWPERAVLESDRVVGPKSYVERILWAAEAALRRHPWRFKLWKAVLIISLRASTVDGNEQRGKLWLERNILPLIRWGGVADDGRLSSRSWEDISPEATDVALEGTGIIPRDGIPPAVQARRRRHRHLRTSFHRACFWRQWAKIVRVLHAIAEDRLSAPPEAWTSHFTPADAKKVLRWFGNWKAWASILYPDKAPKAGDKSAEPSLWWWETESLLYAWLAASVPSQDLLRALGNPRREALRFPREALRRLIETELGEDLRSLRKSLQYSLGYEGSQRPVADITTSPQRLALLWFTRLHTPPNTEHAGSSSLFAALNEDLRPRRGRDALLWAALARVSLWDEWPSICDSIGTHLASPDDSFLKSTGALYPLWSKLIRLDAFAQIRRLLLAHGASVPWGMFRNWFPEIATSRAASSPPDHSLLAAMYCFAGTEGLPPDALVPAIGLPVAVGASLVRGLRRRLERERRRKQDVLVTPDTVFVSRETFRCLTKSRQAMLKAAWHTHWYDRIIEPLMKVLNASEERLIRRVTPLADSRRAPHPLFLFPDLVFNLKPESREKDAWCIALLLLWMLSGGEHELDRLYEVAPWHGPLSDRQRLRSRFMLPESIWMYLEEALGSARSKREPWAHDLGSQKSDPLDPTGWHVFGSAGDHSSNQTSTGRETSLKIRDVRFNSKGQWYVNPGDAGGDREEATQEAFLPEFNVRLIQVVSTPSWPQWRDRLLRGSTGPRYPEFRALVDEISERLAEAHATARAQVDYEKREHLVMTPEWSVPAGYVRKLEQFVRETGVGILAGLLPRELPRAVKAIRSLRRAGWRTLANEAVLILPGFDRRTNGTTRSLPPTQVHTFWIRKPFASVAELGLIRYLTQQSCHARWTFVPGIEWYRFTYGEWGSFSVSICSDILDTFIWDWLRGRIQHLLVIAWNKDVDLFDQVSWTRGYELYANVALVNHGSDGGSVVWSPKHGHDKEVFHVRGAEYGLAVTVAVPVRDLVEAQENQLQRSIEKQRQNWARMMDKGSSGTHHGANPTTSFKTPAPNYRRRRD